MGTVESFARQTRGSSTRCVCLPSASLPLVLVIRLHYFYLAAHFAAEVVRSPTCGSFTRYAVWFSSYSVVGTTTGSGGIDIVREVTVFLILLYRYCYYVMLSGSLTSLSIRRDSMMFSSLRVTSGT